jgi:SNF2 family DNA or RNA helicase
MESNRKYSSYQLVHLLKLNSNGMNGLLISDGVGVGKTISAGYIIEYCIEVLKRPVLVCCPPVLEQKWVEELKLRFGRNVFSSKSKEDFQSMVEEVQESLLDDPRVYILSYSSARNFRLPSNLSFGLAVFDEIHHARNHDTILHEKLLEIAQISTFRVGLSATPIHNSVSDLVSIFSVLFPRFSHEVWGYVLAEIWGRKAKTKFLHPLLTKFDKRKLGIHFTKRSITQIEIDMPATFNRFVNAMIEKKGVSRGKELSAFEKMAYLRLASSGPAAFYKSMDRDILSEMLDPKLESLFSLIQRERQGRWLIFTEFHETAVSIATRLERYAPRILSGETSFSERYLAIDEFRKNQDGILIMLPVGCEGLDLQICSRLVNYDLHWNPMVIEQRIGRIDRIGQNKPRIQIFNFVVTGSLDVHMLGIMSEKIGVVSETFAEVDSFIGQREEILDLANSLIDELPDARGFELFSSLGKSIPDVDYDLAGLLPDSICAIEDWVNTPELWQACLSSSIISDLNKQLSFIRTETLQIKQILADFT